MTVYVCIRGVNVTVTVFGWHVGDEVREEGPVTTQEQADDILKGRSLELPSKHIETILPGNEVVCVTTVAVYVAQNAVT